MAGFTYTTLKQAIQDYTENTESTFVGQLNTFILTAEERLLKDSRLSVFRKNTSASMTSGNKYFPKPSDWLGSYSMSILVSGAHKFLLHKDVNFLQDYWPTASTTGVPKYYADFAVDSFIIAPTPNSAYSTELHYFYRPASITSVVSGTTWLGTNASQALLYAALIEAYTFMKGESELLSQYEERYAAALGALRRFGAMDESSDAYRVGS